MTDNPVWSAHWKARVAVVRINRGAIFTAALCVAFAGCAEHQRPKLPRSVASAVRPRVPAPSSGGALVADEQAAEEPVELRLDLAPPEAVPSLTPQPRPARPHVAATQPPPAESSKPEKPFVVPQLSVEESSSAQQEATASLSEAEKSVAATRGKALNAAQADMASKIAGFIADARTAAAGGDWPSARNLARKAQLLSQELAKSLE
jgi:hypothetical protein